MSESGASPRPFLYPPFALHPAPGHSPSQVCDINCCTCSAQRPTEPPSPKNENQPPMHPPTHPFPCQRRAATPDYSWHIAPRLPQWPPPACRRMPRRRHLPPLAPVRACLCVCVCIRVSCPLPNPAPPIPLLLCHPLRTCTFAPWRVPNTHTLPTAWGGHPEWVCDGDWPLVLRRRSQRVSVRLALRLRLPEPRCVEALLCPWRPIWAGVVPWGRWVRRLPSLSSPRDSGLVWGQRGWGVAACSPPPHPCGPHRPLLVSPTSPAWAATLDAATARRLSSASWSSGIFLPSFSPSACLFASARRPCSCSCQPVP